MPVIVKTSYFPNWKVEGAKGPWRATPNLMVVVPTEKEVTLDYSRSSVEVVSILLTLFGLISLAFVARKSSSSDFSFTWFDSNLIFPDFDKRLDKWAKSNLDEYETENFGLLNEEVQS